MLKFQNMSKYLYFNENKITCKFLKYIILVIKSYSE